MQKKIYPRNVPTGQAKDFTYYPLLLRAEYGMEKGQMGKERIGKAVLSLTKADWERAEKELSSVFGYIKLTVDGYNVSVRYVKEKPTKYCLAVYIDNVFEIKWCLEDCDIRRRFCCQHKTAIINKSKFIKDFGKREYNRLIKEHPEHFYSVYYTPWFGSFQTLKNHLIKNNKSIEFAE